jgi:colanic acid/amylovoran biosynthesis glycosyltransferase
VLENWSVCERVVSLTVLKEAIAECFHDPVASLRQLHRVMKARTVGIACKNLAICPKALWLARLATRWHADHIYAQWAGTSASMAMIAGSIASIPWSFTAHRWDIAEDNLLQEKIASAAFVRFISRDGYEVAVSRCSGNRVRHCIVLHMGVDVPAIDRPALPRQPATVVLCVASLIQRKGHIHLFEAVRLLRDRGVYVEVLLAGDGPMRRRLVRVAKDFGIARQTRFLGEVPHSELMGCYSGGRVTMVVLPSLSEGIAVSLMEAMSYGVPVIATDVGGTTELVGGGAGVLVTAGQSENLAEQIEFLASNPEHRVRLGEEGRRRIEADFDVRKIVAELVRCMEANTAASGTGAETDPAEVSQLGRHR